MLCHVAKGLAPPVPFQQVSVPGIRFRDDIKDVTENGHDADRKIDADVLKRLGEGLARGAHLPGIVDDDERYHTCRNVADPRLEPNN